jgi:hypothetical protein
MPDLTLDPVRTAAVVIDLQKGILGRPTQPHTVVADTARVLRVSRRYSAILLAATAGVLFASFGGAMLRAASDEREPLVVRAEHLRFVRSLEVVWVAAEAGAPALFLGSPESGELETLAKVRGIYGAPQASREELIAFYRDGMRAAEAFLAHATLAPGRYQYQSPLSGSDLAKQPFAAKKLCLIRDGTVTVDVRPEHLALLKRATIVLGDDGGLEMAAGIDCKRPYGDMTFFELDMADALGIKPEGPPYEERPNLRRLSAAQLQHLDKLHEEMQPVLQV